MKKIFQRKAFWGILVILLLAVFVYPPFIEKRGRYYERSWDWFFSSGSEVDLKMLLVEAIIVILLSIGICLIPFKKIWMLLGFISSGIKESLKEEPKD